MNYKKLKATSTYLVHEAPNVTIEDKQLSIKITIKLCLVSVSYGAPMTTYCVAAALE
jgi:hypothetical protein